MEWETTMSIKLIDAETGELLPAPRNLPTDMFLDFERQDNDSIIAELRGEIIEEYAYSFTQGGQTVVGLSLPGVMSVAQQMGGITCGKPEWTYTDDDVMCDIAATDHKTGLTFWGTASEPRVMHTRNGDKLDKFARQKALSKAQRNAILKLIPATVAKKALEMALEKMGKLPGKNTRLAPNQSTFRSEPVHAIDAPPTGTGPLDALGRNRALDIYNQLIALRNYDRADIDAWMRHNGFDGVRSMPEMNETQADAMRRDAIQRKRPWLDTDDRNEGFNQTPPDNQEPPIDAEPSELIGDDFDAEEAGL
jgi:hypothetical protein